jgi:heme exporter protein D
MHWSSWQDFFAMGGSGPFVWGAYGVVALALAVEMLALRARVRRAREAAHRTSEWADKEGQR